MSKMKILCPLLKQECVEDGGEVLQADGTTQFFKCRFWVSFQGRDPQTGKSRDEYDCAFCWQPILQTETSHHMYKTQVEVNKLRNETVDGSNKIAGAVALASRGLPFMMQPPTAPEGPFINGDPPQIENEG